MQFKQGAKVFAADEDRVGTIDRIVIEPDTREVTHLVIHKGVIFSKNKVIPISLVDHAAEDHVTLRENVGDLESFPDFQESHFISAERGNLPVRDAEQQIRTLYWYPPIGSFDSAVYTMPTYVVKTKNIPESSVAIAGGANVISSDGEHVGDIERIFTGADKEQATHFLISEGLFLKEKKLVPTRWLTNVFEHEVHLSVDSNLIEQLPEYRIQY